MMAHAGAITYPTGWVYIKSALLFGKKQRYKINAIKDISNIIDNLGLFFNPKRRVLQDLYASAPMIVTIPVTNTWP